MVEGDYVTDRDYRARFHKWLTMLWKEKDSRIKSLQEA
jgi:hypothetical protein